MGDVQEPVWRAVAELEKERFTREEIADMLENVAEDVRPDRWSGDGVFGER